MGPVVADTHTGPRFGIVTRRKRSFNLIAQVRQLSVRTWQSLLSDCRVLSATNAPMAGARHDWRAPPFHLRQKKCHDFTSHYAAVVSQVCRFCTAQEIEVLLFACQAFRVERLRNFRLFLMVTTRGCSIAFGPVTEFHAAKQWPLRRAHASSERQQFSEKAEWRPGRLGYSRHGRRADGQPRVFHERAKQPCDASRAASRGSLSSALTSLSHAR